MAKRTNKTDHVLNLLTSGMKNQLTDAEEGKREHEAADEGEKVRQQENDMDTSVTVVQNAESDVAEQVKEMLEKELAEELDAGGNEETGTEETRTEEQSAEPQEETNETEKTEENKEMEEKKETEETNKTEKEEEEEQDFVMLNVMETLIKKNVDSYMKKFNVCQCARCKIDVMALALTDKPSKYVVLQRNSVTPLLNFFEARNQGEMTSRLARACSIVAENPRH